MKTKIISILLLVLMSFSVNANQVEIVKVEFQRSGDHWRVNTTLKHHDTGWEHYADAWRVVDESGKKLGERILFHPHENEQPFTRSLNRLVIPKDITIVYLEAHDKKHGWSKQRVLVDLSKSKGDRYRVVH